MVPKKIWIVQEKKKKEPGGLLEIKNIVFEMKTPRWD